MIRRATPDDSDRIAELFRRSYGTLTFLPTLHTPDEDRAFFRGVVAEQEVWVAEEDGRLLGFLALKGEEGTFLYVDPTAQDKGVGSALFEQAQRHRPEGFTFWAFQRNERARAFYERRGCRALKLTEGGGNEEKEPDVLYEWRPRADRGLAL